MSRKHQRGLVRARWLPVAAAAALVLALLILGDQPQGTPSLPLSSAARPDPSPTTAAPSAPQSTAAVAPLPLVKSWQGTEVAGDIHLDAAGNVIPDEDLHELFDYLLSASNVLSPEQIRQHLLTVGHRHALGNAALAQLDGLFARYNDYRAAAARLPADGSDPAAMRRSFEDRHRLREQKLGPQMAEGFFGDSEAQDRYQLAVLDLVNDKSLSDGERQRRLAALKDRAPADVVAARQPSETLQSLQEQTEALRKSGADESQIEALRMQTLGPEAAARLQAVDQENAAWNQRMQALRQTRSQILADAGIAQADKQHAIDDYIDKNFSGPEAIRARALLSLETSS